MNNVAFLSADRKLSIPGKIKLKQFVSALFTREGKVLDALNYIFCSDAYLLEINRTFLNHDDYTDIITFDLSESRKAITGEVYISIDRVKENAKELNIPFIEETRRVIFHGALHLCGYKDKKKSEITLMRNKEEEYLRLYREIS